ncbi:hypothetical protein EDC44_10448 [Cricetibacter osteomyelitidis]|uniref:Toxin VasX N-terminal region domain-containing protein n=1 Tax=Cricetibacter osteomyelitidis TaxID=1521931 RepID=A0A4R2T3E6_9PAST|nr:toxin VasX [Cricetibacter osteomyelitidis]TCP96515.1 hypothetical protein EDC44_10448 [Cricetibacter osteomyelitidis]
MSNDRKEHIGTLSSPNGILSTQSGGSTHQLMQLRQGFVYIYTYNKHRLFSTDKSGKWLVFRYITHTDDMNSASEFERPSGAETHQGQYTFLLYKWGEQGANGKWQVGKLDGKHYPCVANISTFSCPFVDKDADKVDIAYSEYAWSSEIFARLENDSELRQSMMTTVEVNKSQDTHQRLLGSLPSHVLEYGDKDEELPIVTQSWYTQLATQSRLPKQSSMLPYEKALMVALEDVVGEMHELQKVIFDLTEAQNEYYAKYSYPITIGNMIDPKIAYDVQGKAYPFKAEERVIAQKGVQSALISEFNSKMTALLKEPFERYEKPINLLVKQLVQLANQRFSYKQFFTIDKDIVGYTPKEGTTDRGYYVFCRLQADLTCGLECSSEGVKVLESLFSDKSVPSGNAPSVLGWLKEHSQKVTDGVYALAMKVPLSQRAKVLEGYFQGMESIYTFAGRTISNVWAKSEPKAIENYLKIYGAERILNNPEYAFAELAENLVQEARDQLYKYRQNSGKITKKEINRYLSQVKRDLKAQGKISANEINELNEVLARNERFYGFSGVLAIYAGIVSLSNDVSIQRKLIHTPAGKLAMDPIMLKTTAILDISIGSADTAYALGIINKPNEMVAVSGVRNFSGAMRAGLINLRAITYSFASIIGGLLTAVIAFGGLSEAIKNEDNVSMTANGAILGASGVIALSGIFQIFAIDGTLSAALGVASPYAFVIILLATAAIALWGDTPAETWVKKGFWGKSFNYLYWDNKERDKIDKQIKRAQILANEQVAKDAQLHLERAELIATGQVDAVFSTALTMNENIEDYLLISQGFEKELYEYDIQSGLQVTEIGKGYYRISCAEFRYSPPTTSNLIINVYQWGSAQAKAISQFYHTPATKEVTFSLNENRINVDDVRVAVIFTDKEGEVFKGYYETKQFKQRTSELLEKNKALIEKWTAENGELID